MVEFNRRLYGEELKLLGGDGVLLGGDGVLYASDLSKFRYLVYAKDELEILTRVVNYNENL